MNRKIYSFFLLIHSVIFCINGDGQAIGQYVQKEKRALSIVMQELSRHQNLTAPEKELQRNLLGECSRQTAFLDALAQGGPAQMQKGLDKKKTNTIVHSVRVQAMTRELIAADKAGTVTPSFMVGILAKYRKEQEMGQAKIDAFKVWESSYNVVQRGLNGYLKAKGRG